VRRAGDWPGRWQLHVEYWDTLGGSVTSVAARPVGGTLSLEIPPFQRALAIKVRRTS